MCNKIARHRTTGCAVGYDITLQEQAERESRRTSMKMESKAIDNVRETICKERRMRGHGGGDDNEDKGWWDAKLIE